MRATSLDLRRRGLNPFAMLRAIGLCWLFTAGRAMACQTALILSMDVSNSVDEGEYRLQTEGLAAALRDPEIVEILVRDRVALAVMQWSGHDMQELTLPWTQMLSLAQVKAFAAAAQDMPRAFVLSDTAPADALDFALRQFRNAPDCARRIVDVSGDGTPNAGGEIGRARRRAERAGVTVNGLAIEGIGVAITTFYRRSLVTGDGFVVTARGHRDYARAIRLKILREIARVMGQAPAIPPTMARIRAIPPFRSASVSICWERNRKADPCPDGSITAD